MGLFTISSTNQDISYVLGKNPVSGPLIKSYRKGFILGKYCKPHVSLDDQVVTQCYAVWFRDGSQQASFVSRSDSGVAVDVLRYTSPFMYLSLLQEFFKSTINQPNVKDRPASHQLYFPMVKVRKAQTLCSFQRTPGIKVECTPFQQWEKTTSNMAGEEFARSQYYRICIRNELTVNEQFATMQSVMSFTFMLLCALAATNQDTVFQVEDERIVKMAKLINEVNGDYTMRYLCSSRMVASPKLFARVKPMLEAWHTHPAGSIKMHFGNAAFQRREHIADYLTFQHSIAEVGCGEGFIMTEYAKRLSKVRKSLQYDAIDIDEKVLLTAKRTALKRNLDNTRFHHSVDQWLECRALQAEVEPAVEVIMAEVVEHMEVAQATALLKQLFSQVHGMQRLIVTTPNRDFNQYFHMKPNERRHFDHHWEMNRAEFETWLQEWAPPATEWSCQYLMLSDCIGTDSLTQGVLYIKI